MCRTDWALIMVSEVILPRSGIDLLLKALPVSSADDLLAALSDVWAIETRAALLFVSLIVDDTLIGMVREAGGDSQVLRTSGQADPPIQDWSAAAALAAVTRLSDDVTSSVAIEVVEFEVGGQVVGGVLCFDRAGDDQFSASLIEVSARLVAQLRLLGAARDEDELRRRKLEAMAEFAAGAGHEINNPVATIAGRASLLLRSERDPERRRALETIGGQAYRIRDMIGDAMTTARPPAPLKTRFAGADVIREVLAGFDRLIADVGVVVSVDVDDSLDVLADREQFAVVVAALVRNGIEAIDRGVSSRSVRIEWQSRAGQGGASLPILSVEDDGSGLSDTEREHLFDPFFSGRQAGRGLGFGLTKCWRIVEAHGGRITHRDVTPSGLRVEVEWGGGSAPASVE